MHICFMTESIKIIGLDPGLQRTGWGVITSSGNRLTYVAHGVIETPPKIDLAPRLAYLFKKLSEVLETFDPHEAAVEETFVNMNPVSTLKLGMARGVVLMAPSLKHLPVGEYATNRVKKAVVGVGHAGKEQVAMMVQRLISSCPIVSEDAADALAVAICHAHFRLLRKLEAV